MKFDRRELLAAGAGGAALALAPWSALAQDAAEVIGPDELIADFAGGAEVVDGDGVSLDAPEIAENGNTVPISVDAPGASEIMVIATGNPVPAVAVFKFGALAGAHSASTRIRLAQTQDVLAIAKLEDGSFVRTGRNVKVTIGGCGG